MQLSISILALSCIFSGLLEAAERPPNFLIIFCDNLGYGDVGCFGSKLHRTPNLDRMAAEGTKFTHFYVSSGVCTPSRASLMTGCYPRRVNLHLSGQNLAVLRPMDRKGLNPNELTIARVLKNSGYATACVGKWHLGDQPQFLPTRHGFDYYFGIPYSDDMTHDKDRRGEWPPLPLMRNDKVIEAPVDRDTLTQRYTAEVIRFITEHKAQPFFVYMPQAMPGSTARPFASERFKGKSANGPYGDSVEELDWSAGEVMSALRRLGLDERTLVVWTADNGAVKHDPPQGSNGPLGGWAYTTAEGAMRVPCIMRWPGKIPAGGECAELATTMDLLPTLAQLAGTKPPSDRVIDGRDIWPLMSNKDGARSPHEAFFYYHVEQLQAVRSGPWKLYLPLKNRQLNLRGKTGESPAKLFNVVTDSAEKQNLSAQHADIVSRLTALAERAREDLGDLNRPGKNQRSAGWEENPKPQRM